MSWQPQVKVHGNGDKWSSNALIFATESEAKAYANDLFMRWTACDDHRAVEVDEPATHAWVDGELKHVEKAP